MASDANAPRPQAAPAHPPEDWRFGFWSLIATQFQGAFNDNALKFLVIYLIVAMNFPPARRDLLVLVVGALFAIPFLIFSMTGGYFADRYSKRIVTIGTKYFEIGVMLFATTALALGNLTMECASVFLISTQGALFGPSKYGLLPELLPEKKLSWGNGVIELGTFLAAISAVVAAGYLSVHFSGRQIFSGLALLGCTAAGLATSFGISRVPAANPAAKFRPNPLGDVWKQIQIMRSDRILAWAVIGNTYLWYLAALLQFVIVIYGHDVLRVNDTEISYLQAAIGIGIGFGSLAAGYLSGGKIEYGLVPLGALGMMIFSLLVSRAGLTVWHVRAGLALLGFFGGFYAVPLGALIQFRPRPETKGGVIAAANFLSFVGVVAAAVAYYGLAEGLHLGARQIFLAGAGMTFLAGLYASLALSDSLLRSGLWIATHTVYRVRVEGREHLPDRAGVVLFAPALSRLQQLMLLSVLDRQVEFVTPPDEPRPWNTSRDALCICSAAQPLQGQMRSGFLSSRDNPVSGVDVVVVAPRGSRIFSSITVRFSPRPLPPQTAAGPAIAEQAM
jgi:acyl-[acyl-carrier-protein]-phospholipid O-acyltransferase/long-chain-fatty-acid--[acyl-carrier-protein] ligase